MPKRGRGRPRKAEYDQGYGNNQKLDPTGEMFLRAESRIGGPTDPITSFEAANQLLFPGRYKDYTNHPMHQYVMQFSFERTPLAFT